MKNGSTRRLPLICTASIALLGFAAKSQAATVIWTGGAGPSVVWSDVLNWAGGVAPVTGDAPTFDGITGARQYQRPPGRHNFPRAHF